MPKNRSSVESVVLVLTGYVDLHALGPVVQAICRKARQQPARRYVLECSQVSDFSSYALAALAQLRRQLHQQRSDLVLVNCTEYVKSRMVDPLFEALVADEPVTKTQKQPAPCQSLARMAPKAFYLYRMERQRFWLN